MSAGRRLALLEYARQHDAWIVEDDYDSEFRYSGEPVPAMSGMMKQAPVVYIGTFSKTLFPALRIGFVVMPPALAQAAQGFVGSLRGGTGLSSERWRCLSKRALRASSGGDAALVLPAAATAHEVLAAELTQPLLFSVARADCT